VELGFGHICPTPSNHGLAPEPPGHLRAGEQDQDELEWPVQSGGLMPDGKQFREA
jgi:hypothetical protein